MIKLVLCCSHLFLQQSVVYFIKCIISECCHDVCFCPKLRHLLSMMDPRSDETISAFLSTHGCWRLCHKLYSSEERYLIFNMKEKIIKPFCCLCVASELGRIVGNSFKAKDLGGGEAAGERGLLHLPWSPADQGGQRGCRQVEFGGDSWPDGVVTKLPPLPQLQHLVDREFPFRDDWTCQQGQDQTLWMGIPCPSFHIWRDGIFHLSRLGSEKLVRTWCGASMMRWRTLMSKYILK